MISKEVIDGDVKVLVTGVNALQAILGDVTKTEKNQVAGRILSWQKYIMVIEKACGGIVSVCKIAFISCL